MMRRALEMAAQVRSGAASALEILADTEALIRERDPALNSFTGLTMERARREAAAVDALRASGTPLPPLAGVPYAVKNLFDIEGEVTLAGGWVNRGNAPAAVDAELVRRMHAAGAVLVGALNMDEHAYGFTTENTHYGATRNPHDASRVAGGSSGGSAAAVAGGLVPLTLGSDTNGSIRVPSSLCGIFGLKPTFGRLPRTGSFPFVHSLDHLGPFAACVDDLAAAYDALQGHDPGDPACAPRAAEPVSGAMPDLCGARVAVLGGWFERWAGAAALEAVDMAAAALGATRKLEWKDAEAARSAAFIITGAEGGALHRLRLQGHYDDYEPLSRDRLVAGSLIPSAWLAQAQRVRRRAYAGALALFADADLLIAPATPVQATPVGADTFHIDGRALPLRASMGLLTQPLSCIGLPVCTAPLWPAAGDGALPMGVQLIAAPWREDLCLAAARLLERQGVALARDPAAAAR
jgi:aspartyl-tRNA(Asn)/glutamyl-tRNA(Gln) amidotransferase subunit A